MDDCNIFTLDAASYDDLILGLDEVWVRDYTSEEIEMPGGTAQKLMNGHGMRTVSEIVENGQCRGWTAYWLQNCDDTASTKSDTFPDIGCDIPKGEDPEVKKDEYQRNCFISETAAYSDQDCSSRLRGVDMASMQIQKAMEKIRKTLSQSTTDMLVANAQPNTWAGSYGNATGTWTEFTSAEFTVSLLHHFRNIARHHKCSNYAIIDDTNFWETWQSVIDGQCCGDASDAKTFRRFDMMFDTWLDEYLGRRSTFLVDPQAFGFINTTRYQNTVPEVKYGAGENTLWGWKMSDPLFSIMENTANGSSVRPLEYDIEYKRECCGRDALGNLLFRHFYHITYSGGAYMNPVGCNDGHCIFEMVNIG